MKRDIKDFWPLGIRWQLLLWYISVFALLLLISGSLFYLQLQSSLADSFDTTLQTQAQMINEDIIEDVSESRGKITLQSEAAGLPDFNIDHKTALIHYKTNFGAMICLLNAQGERVRETIAFRTLFVPTSSILASVHGENWIGTITSRGGSSVRLYSQPLFANGRIFAIIQVAQSLGTLHDTLKHVTKELLKLGLLVLLLSSIGMYVLTYRAFTPIRHLIQAARAIKAGDFHKRVLVPHARDEVHLLALTLNEMIAYLDEMFTRQQRFVADASHELRTPIAVIRSKTDVALLQTNLSVAYATVLREINTEVVRLSHLINDLLALARGDEGQTHFEREPVRLDKLAEVVAANAETLVIERLLTLHLQTSGPVVVLGDEARLIQMLINLLDNAIFYTNAGGSITLVVEQTQMYATLVVKDTGIGIAPEHLPHIFERFYRADPARMTTERGSSGLGLSLVEWIVLAHKGTISVESRGGQGSTFTVKLPVIKPDPATLR